MKSGELNEDEQSLSGEESTLHKLTGNVQQPVKGMMIAMNKEMGLKTSKRTVASGLYGLNC